MLIALACAAVVALVVLVDARPWEKPPPTTFTVTITIDDSNFREAMAAAAAATSDFHRIHATGTPYEPRHGFVDISTLDDPGPVWYPTHPEEPTS